MKAILRTNAYDEPYEIVEVIKSPISERNGLAIVKRKDGAEIWTGGILCEVHPTTIKILNTMTGKEQFDWLSGIRVEIYVKEE